ncbi:MAG TPA: hypothetical protein VGL99_14185, partial [Chloroflexota bacterium]
GRRQAAQGCVVACQNGACQPAWLVPLRFSSLFAVRRRICHLGVRQQRLRSESILHRNFVRPGF